MKKTYVYYLFFCFLIMFFTRCSKPYQQALPIVQFVSAVPYGLADTLLLSGYITSAGASDVEYTGFSFSNVPTFDLLSHQVLLNSNPDGTFSALVTAYNDSTYYFEAFAANQYGYTVSNVFKYTVPAAKPDSAPCNIPRNTIIFNDNNWTPASVFGSGGQNPYGSYYVEADFGAGYSIDIYFNMVPTNGEYLVLSPNNFVGYNGSHYIATLIMDQDYPFNQNGYVYITQNKDGSTTLSFCSLVVNMFSTNFPVSAKITYH